MGKGTNSSLDKFTELTIFDFFTYHILFNIHLERLFFCDFKGAFIAGGCLFKKFILQEILLFESKYPDTQINKENKYPNTIV